MIAPAERPATDLSAAQTEMIEAGSRLCQWIGVPRSVGQIYGLLFMSVDSLTLDDIAERLSISKGSASTGTRQLLAWRAIRQVWVPGERRDHFVVEPDFGNLIRSTYRDFLKPRLSSSSDRIARIAKALEEEGSEGKFNKSEQEICAKRLEMLRGLHKKLQALVPIAEKLL
ncbi:MAG: hypothetical protein O2960_19150 [Verrucomicrobia bacterium]|nr:hypothetical protein [Verrucomicrobiota bacterium]